MKWIKHKWVRRGVSISCSLPLLLLIVRFFTGRLGADPVSTLLLSTGDWTMRFLLLTLMITPIMELSGWRSIFFLRRLLGLFALLYAALHFLVYLGLDYLFNVEMILRESQGTPFIIIGFASFLLLIPLGITSLKSVMQRMKRGTWRIVHSLVYIISIGGIVHYLLKLKVISLEFVVYTVLLALLLVYRPVSKLFLKSFIANRLTTGSTTETHT